ncbi:hypothetical protein LCGC14_1805440, partial [marine sediment metagenome]
GRYAFLLYRPKPAPGVGLLGSVLVPVITTFSLA